MAQLGYMPIKLLISTSVYSLGAIGGIKAAFQSLARGELGDLTTLIYDAREQVFERIKSEASAMGAEEVVGIKTSIVELGSSLVEIFAVGTAVRKLQGMSVKTPALPAQAITGAGHHKGQGHLAEQLERARDSIAARRRLSEET